MASQALPPPSVAVKANGSALGGTAMAANAVPPSNAAPTSPSNISPTSSAFHTSPTALPPILPAHVPKDVSLNSGLLNTNRAASPSARPASERISQNPAAILKSGALGMSRASDGPPLAAQASVPAPSPGNQPALIETTSKVNQAGQIGQSAESVPTSGGESQQESLTSPKSATSVGSLDPSLTATSGVNSETSPTRTRTASVSEPAPFVPQGSTQATAPPFSPTAPSATSNDQRGSVSSIGPDARASVSSVGGSRGKHTCPHCQQTFTRHHNLKSHLLTHSHEKPFQCTTCTSRFRRLHDLKRHQKLHTGERPHVCTSCGRKFARGDALARHARGEGGCAGRRSSMSALGEEGYEGDGDHMEGLEMSGDLDDEMPDYEGPTQSGGGGTPGRRTASLPSLRTRTISASQQGSQASKGHQGFQVPPPPMHLPPQQHHTYPPGGHAQQSQPSVPFGQSGPKIPGSMSASSTSVGSGSITAGSTAPSTILSHELTASPRSLSPNAQQQSASEGPSVSSSGRTPSAPSFHQQAIENRRRSNTGVNTLPPPGISIPQPGQLPQLGGHPGPTSPRTARSARGSFSNALASPATNQQQSGQGNIFSSGEEGIWAYIQNLEKRILDLEQKNRDLEGRMTIYEAERSINATTQAEKLKG